MSNHKKTLACIVCGPINRTVKLVNNNNGDLVIKDIAADWDSPVTVYSLGQYEEITDSSGIKWGRTFRVAQLPEDLPRHGHRLQPKGTRRGNRRQDKRNNSQAVPQPA